MKKVIAPIVLIASLTLAGCGSSTPAANSAGSNAASSSASQAATTSSSPAPADLTGTWKQSNSKSETSYQQATITKDKITVNWILDGGNTKAVYWVGTFAAPKTADEPYAFSSKRDAKATDNAMMASSDDAKEFTYKDGVLSYEVTALGVTTTVTLEKE